jgi:hypothetical protein
VVVVAVVMWSLAKIIVMMMSSSSDVYREGGEDMTTEDSTTQHTISHDTLLHYTTSHHTTPIPPEIFPPSTAVEDPPVWYQFRYGPAGVYTKAIVLLPCDGRLIPCGLVTVVVKGK